MYAEEEDIARRIEETLNDVAKRVPFPVISEFARRGNTIRFKRANGDGAVFEMSVHRVL